MLVLWMIFVVVVFFGGGGGGNNATASIHCKVKNESQRAGMGLNLTSCAQFAALSLVKSVLTHVRAFVTADTCSLMNLPIYSNSTEEHGLPNFYLFIFIWLFQESKVMSWWDYGYQITAMANRTILVDNNTWNNTHISRVGQVRQHVMNTCFSLQGNNSRNNAQLALCSAWSHA